MTIDKTAGMPIYKQLMEIIKSDIRKKSIGAGEKVPSENALAGKHGISRMTARHAMRELKNKGWIVTQHGRGSFVCSRKRMEMLLKRDKNQSGVLSKLTGEQISVLTKNCCKCGDWGRVMVGNGFDPGRVVQAVFAGDVSIVGTQGTIEISDGISRPCGIYRAKLRNTSVADGCCIADVNGWLSNLDIGTGVMIENVGVIACVGETTFGNGHEVKVLVEAGGREVKITGETSAQIAYLTAFYRDKKPLIEKLNAMADDVAAKMKNTRMTIGAYASVRNCTEIINVYIGNYAKVYGVLCLKEGAIVSSKESPVTVGNGVVADHFIIQRGASVTDGAMVASSLVGEGVKMGKQFSSENSLFFANCEGFHSEVCACFAGPYTVTHHRSTLLIGGMFSFYNAGSGTNQSNHLYKLGPLHQGIMERGAKTGSSSYLLWPSRVGAFTTVIGKHHAHFDASDFPFSFINEHNGKSTIVPGKNIFTVGTLRDVEKWPERDRRTAAKNLDMINFPAFSPYTVQKIVDGRALLAGLFARSSDKEPYVTWKGICIKRPLLKISINYYRIAMDKYFGDCLLKRIAGKEASAVRSAMEPVYGADDGTGVWVDASGLLCAKTRLDAIVSSITSGLVASQQALNEEFEKIQASYGDDEWNWVLSSCKKVYGHNLQAASKEAIIALLERWRDASLKMLNMVVGDIEKEFADEVRVGFGIDGNRDEDFSAVRGSIETNNYVMKLKSEMETVNSTFSATKAIVSSLV